MPRKVAEKKSVEIDRSRTPFLLIGIIVVGGLLTTGAVMWGKSDVGAIDVSATMANSQYTADNIANGNASVGAATQEYVDMPNGGLLPPGSDTTPAPMPEPVVVENASSTGTTTPTTTESTTEDGGDASVSPSSESSEVAETSPSEESGSQPEGI